MIRLFAGLALPDAATARLATLQPGLPGRLVDPSGFHVTLAFFGELPETTAADLHAALGAVRAPGFALVLDGAGVFGGRRPQSIHALVRPDPALAHLHEKVTRAGRAAGASIEARRFTPHVTLARFDRDAVSDAAAAKALAGRAAFLAGPWPIEDFRLYRSELGRGGSVYVELARYPLDPPAG